MAPALTPGTSSAGSSSWKASPGTCRLHRAARLPSPWPRPGCSCWTPPGRVSTWPPSTGPSRGPTLGSMTLLPSWCATPPLTRRLRAVQGPGTQQARQAAHLRAVRGGLRGSPGPFWWDWGGLSLLARPPRERPFCGSCSSCWTEMSPWPWPPVPRHWSRTPPTCRSWWPEVGSRHPGPGEGREQWGRPGGGGREPSAASAFEWASPGAGSREPDVSFPRGQSTGWSPGLAEPSRFNLWVVAWPGARGSRDNPHRARLPGGTPGWSMSQFSHL